MSDQLRPGLRRRPVPRTAALAVAGAGIGLACACWMLSRLPQPCEPSTVVVSCPPCRAAAEQEIAAPDAGVAADAGPADAEPADAGPPDAAPAAPRVDSCRALPPVGDEVVYRALEQDLEVAGTMLIGESERHGLDYDLRDALSCVPRKKSEPMPTQCDLAAGSRLRVGGVELHTAVYETSHEWDGMYGLRETVVLLIEEEGELHPIHGLTQWDQDVPDCYTSLLQQRQRTGDLDGDGSCELCVESVEEVGEGLFTVMDVRRWRPERRRRALRAYRLEGSSRRLVRAAELDQRCPRRGYQHFAEREASGDSVAWRGGVQGGRRTPRKPAKPWQDPCNNKHFE